MLGKRITRKLKDVMLLLTSFRNIGYRGGKERISGASVISKEFLLLEISDNILSAV